MILYLGSEVNGNRQHVKEAFLLLSFCLSSLIIKAFALELFPGFCTPFKIYILLKKTKAERRIYL